MQAKTPTEISHAVIAVDDTKLNPAQRMVKNVTNAINSDTLQNSADLLRKYVKQDPFAKSSTTVIRLHTASIQSAQQPHHVPWKQSKNILQTNTLT